MQTYADGVWAKIKKWEWDCEKEANFLKRICFLTVVILWWWVGKTQIRVGSESSFPLILLALGKCHKHWSMPSCSWQIQPTYFTIPLFRSCQSWMWNPQVSFFKNVISTTWKHQTWKDCFVPSLLLFLMHIWKHCFILYFFFGSWRMHTPCACAVALVLHSVFIFISFITSDLTAKRKLHEQPHLCCILSQVLSYSSWSFWLLIGMLVFWPEGKKRSH